MGPGFRRDNSSETASLTRQKPTLRTPVFLLVFRSDGCAGLAVAPPRRSEGSGAPKGVLIESRLRSVTRALRSARSPLGAPPVAISDSGTVASATRADFFGAPSARISPRSPCHVQPT